MKDEWKEKEQGREGKAREGRGRGKRKCINKEIDEDVVVRRKRQKKERIHTDHQEEEK